VPGWQTIGEWMQPITAARTLAWYAVTDKTGVGDPTSSSKREFSQASCAIEAIGAAVRRRGRAASRGIAADPP